MNQSENAIVTTLDGQYLVALLKLSYDAAQK